MGDVVFEISMSLDGFITGPHTRNERDLRRGTAGADVDLHVLPRLLGDGTRLYDVAGRSIRKLLNLGRR
jgi:hypothetical protein